MTALSVGIAAGLEAGNAGLQAHRFNWAVVGGAAVAAIASYARVLIKESVTKVAETVLVPLPIAPSLPDSILSPYVQSLPLKPSPDVPS